MSIPLNLLNKLTKYPAILASLEPVYDKPSLPTGYQPKVVDIFCDQRHALQWVSGYLTHIIDVDTSYSPTTIEWAIDGEIVYVLLGNEIIFSRLENPISLTDLTFAQFNQGDNNHG